VGASQWKKRSYWTAIATSTFRAAAYNPTETSEAVLRVAAPPHDYADLCRDRTEQENLAGVSTISWSFDSMIDIAVQCPSLPCRPASSYRIPEHAKPAQHPSWTAEHESEEIPEELERPTRGQIKYFLTLYKTSVCQMIGGVRSERSLPNGFWSRYIRILCIPLDLGTLKSCLSETPHRRSSLRPFASPAWRFQLFKQVQFMTQGGNYLRLGRVGSAGAAG
jgi:hypothetical protein